MVVTYQIRLKCGGFALFTLIYILGYIHVFFLEFLTTLKYGFKKIQKKDSMVPGCQSDFLLKLVLLMILALWLV
jgi:hypothetical protein